MRRRDAAVESLRAGHYALIAALVAVLLAAAWLALGTGRHGSLSDCLTAVPWLREALGAGAVAVGIAGVALVVASLFGESRWWGLSAVALALVSLPVLLVLTLVFMYGDISAGPGICQSAAQPPLLD